ncbi:MAG TPA: hypothetical protein K8V84_15590 [Nocardiopsis listeri]|nr:hypothetical protein [Nocardiopsis listeri]
MPGPLRSPCRTTPEPKAGPGRVHMDVRVDGIVETTERLRTRGTTVVGDVVTGEQGSFQVLRDPEGNGFCLVRPASPRVDGAAHHGGPRSRCRSRVRDGDASGIPGGHPARRSTAALTRSSVTVKATRTWRSPVGP